MYWARSCEAYVLFRETTSSFKKPKTILFDTVNCVRENLFSFKSLGNYSKNCD